MKGQFPSPSGHYDCSILSGQATPARSATGTVPPGFSGGAVSGRNPDFEAAPRIGWFSAPFRRQLLKNREGRYKAFQLETGKSQCRTHSSTALNFGRKKHRMGLGGRILETTQGIRILSTEGSLASSLINNKHKNGLHDRQERLSHIGGTSIPGCLNTIPNTMKPNGSRNPYECRTSNRFKSSSLSSLAFIPQHEKATDSGRNTTSIANSCPSIYSDSFLALLQRIQGKHRYQSQCILQSLPPGGSCEFNN
jgi:hypothetical protein